MNAPPVAPAALVALDRHARRAGLTSAANPRPQQDFTVSLRRAVAPFELSIEYVPDRLVLRAEGLDAYLGALPAGHEETPEALASRIFEDLVNALVPRWLRLSLHRPEAHRVTFEERQPAWTDPGGLVSPAVGGTG